MLLGWVGRSTATADIYYKQSLNQRIMKAFYDNKPSKLEALGNGSYAYRYDIEEQTIEVRSESESEPVSTRTQWSCEEVIVWAPVTSNKITEAVIADICPASHEQKLVNEYNAAKLGMVGGSTTSAEAKERIAAYKEFLKNRRVLKEQVDADCSELGIK